MARVRYSAAVTFLPEVERAVDGIRALLASPSIGRIQPHITLVPPGEATPSELDALLFELAGIASTTAPFDLRLGGLGIFPNRRTIGYLRVEDVDGVLVPIGTALGRGHRDFVPHVTVAEAVPRDLLEQVARTSEGMRVDARAERISLLLADLRDRRRRWRPLLTFLLGYGGPRVRSGVECRVAVVEGWEYALSGRSPASCVLALSPKGGALAEGVARRLAGGFFEVARVRVFDPENRGLGLGGMVVSELLDRLGPARVVAADSPFARRYLSAEVPRAMSTAIGLDPAGSWVMRGR